MPWPLPQPSDIADRAATVLEGEFARIYALRNPGAPAAQPDARSPNSLLGAYARTTALTVFDLYLTLAREAQELMPDTAVDWLPRHAAIWGVPQQQPVAAAGGAIFQGLSLTVVPSGFALTAPGGAAYVTNEAGTITNAGTVDITVQAQTAGAAGNLGSLVALTPVSPLGGLTSVAVDANGITGGQDAESLDSWRARILRRIRQRGSGGSADDYEQWVDEVIPGAMSVAMSPGSGLVTVAVAIPASPIPRVPTSTELSEIQGYVADPAARKPLTATVTVIPATLTPIDVNLHLNPDTAAIRQGVTNALQLYFQTDLEIGGTLEVSRLDEAISISSGEYSHDRTAPAADYAAGPTELPVLGTIGFS